MIKRNKKTKQLGQGMTEYLLIVALVAVSGIAIIRTTSQNIKAGFAKVANALQGKNNGNVRTENINKSEWESKNMNNFNEDAVK